MSSSTSRSTAVETPRNTTTPPLRRSPTDLNLVRCFICLQSPAETPRAVWVNACPCTLEAHEDCMLSWVAEHERENTKALRCPACKGKIKMTEPTDHLVELRDRLHKVYGRVTPAILLGIITGSSVAGSSCLGLISLCVFAGPGPAISWLRAGTAATMADQRLDFEVPLNFRVIMRFLVLNFIAPALLIHKALSHHLTDFVTLPASVMYGVSLVFCDEMPTWPPSPAWVMTMLPWVTMSYNHLYRDLFGAYEARLNNALRGRPQPTEQPAVQIDAAAENGGDAPAAQQEQRQQQQQEEEGGYMVQILRVGNAMLNMLLGDNGEEIVAVAEIELEIGPEEDEQAVLEELQEELGDIAGHDNHNDNDDADAAPPAPQADQVLNVDDPNNVLAPEELIREARATSTTLADLVNGVVSALTFPIVCWGAGEVLRHALPTAWVTRPPSDRAATGLLQEQWGRSLVGGAVFIVARDMLNLYTKHRRVEVRKQRKIRNVPRRRSKTHGSTGTTTPTS